MKRMVKRFGKLIVASFVIMVIGLVTFLTTPIWLQFGADTDIPGFCILIAGVAVYIIGLIRRRKLSGVKLIALITLASLLSIPMLFLMASIIYYLVTGKELGW